MQNYNIDMIHVAAVAVVGSERNKKRGRSEKWRLAMKKVKNERGWRMCVFVFLFF